MTTLDEIKRIVADWHRSELDTFQFVEFMSANIDKLLAVVDAAKDWNTGHDNLCEDMMKYGRSCRCGYEDICKALKALEEP